MSKFGILGSGNSDLSDKEFMGLVRDIDNLISNTKEQAKELSKSGNRDAARILALLQQADSIRTKIRNKGTTADPEEFARVIAIAKQARKMILNSSISHQFNEANSLSGTNVNQSLQQLSSKEAAERGSKLSINGIPEGADTLALNAISPELGAMAQMAGLKPSDLFKGLDDFSTPEEKTQDLISQTNDNVESLEQAVLDGEDSGEDNSILSSIDKTLMRIEQFFNPDAELHQIEKDRHEEQMAVLEDGFDDVSDAMNDQGGIMSFFGRGGKFGKMISTALGSTARLGVAAAGAASLAHGSFRTNDYDNAPGFFKNNKGETSLMDSKGGAYLQSMASGASVGALFGPIGALVGAGVGLFAAGLTDLFDVTVDDVMDGLGNAFDSAISFITSAPEKIANFVSKADEAIGGFFSGIVGFFTSIPERISSKISDLKTDAELAGDQIKEFFQPVVDRFTSAFQAIAEFLANPLESIKNLAGDALKGIKDLFSSDDSKEEQKEEIKEKSVEVVAKEQDKSPESLAGDPNMKSLDQVEQEKTAEKSEEMRQQNEAINRSNTINTNNSVINNNNNKPKRPTTVDTPVMTSDLGLLLAVGGGA